MLIARSPSNEGRWPCQVRNLHNPSRSELSRGKHRLRRYYPTNWILCPSHDLLFLPYGGWWRSVKHI